MTIKKHFQYDPAIDVSASQVGISKWTWTSIDSSDYERAKKIMKENRFDVLPIVYENGVINSFFSTTEWNNYESIKENQIDRTHQTYYRLSLKDLIRKFKEEGRHYYFLTDYQEILGLVSLVNLNSQLVYNYFYFILSDIERGVANLLKAIDIPQDEILNHLKKSKDAHQQKIASSFEKSIESNVDNDIFQHMYLQTLGIILKKLESYLPERGKRLLKYREKFLGNGTYNLIRNNIMHPVKPILSDKESISQIDELLTDYSEIKSIIG